jgi:hypothetical protein
MNYFSRLALNLDPPDSILPGSYDYKCEALAPWLVLYFLTFIYLHAMY